MDAKPFASHGGKPELSDIVWRESVREINKNL